MLIVDAHEDLAWNMLTFGRDYTRSAAETRQLEASTETPSRNGDTLLGWPDYQRGRVAVVFGALFAAPRRAQVAPWDGQCYTSFDEAHQVYSAQLDAYHRLVDEQPDKFRLVQTRRDLQEVLAAWEDGGIGDRGGEPGRPVGLVALMEGAEGVRQPAELELWWARGLRVISPAWMGTRYCGGMREPGPLTPDGYALLEAMADFGFVLDISHMDEQAALQSLEVYPGRVIASHSNAAALLQGSRRHLSDAMLRELAAHDGVSGIVPFNRFLLPGWQTGDGRHRVTARHVVAQIDYICQRAGSARHVGWGTDFDGGWGLQAAPDGWDTIADLHTVAPLLAEKGYAPADIAAVMGEDWLRVLHQTLPEA